MVWKDFQSFVLGKLYGRGLLSRSIWPGSGGEKGYACGGEDYVPL